MVCGVMNHSSRSIGCADLAQLAVELEGTSGPHVGDEVRRVDHQAGVVAPLHRVADLRRELLQLVQGPAAGVWPHPLELLDALAVGLDEVGDQHVHPLLGRGREVPRRRRSGRRPRPSRPRPARRRASSARAAEGCRSGCGRRSRSSPRRTPRTGTAAAWMTCQHSQSRHARKRVVGEQAGQPGAEARLAEHDLVEGAHRAGPGPLSHPRRSASLSQRTASAQVRRL